MFPNTMETNRRTHCIHYRCCCARAWAHSVRQRTWHWSKCQTQVNHLRAGKQTSFGHWNAEYSAFSSFVCVCCSCFLFILIFFFFCGFKWNVITLFLLNVLLYRCDCRSVPSSKCATNINNNCRWIHAHFSTSRNGVWSLLRTES